MLIASFVIAFIKGWKLALVVISIIPILAVAGAIYVNAIQTKEKRNPNFMLKQVGLLNRLFEY